MKMSDGQPTIINPSEPVSQNKRQNNKGQSSGFFTGLAKSKQQFCQTTIQINNSSAVQKQSGNNLPLTNQKSEVSQAVKQTQRVLKSKSYLMEMVNHYIYEIADRNQAIKANYAHFLVLLYLTLQEITLNIHPSENLQQAKKFIFLKLQKQTIRKQLNQALYYEFMTLILRKQKIQVKLIHSFMRKVMTMERYVCIAVFPYYFNLFAMVLNKEIIFNGNELQGQENLIPYTFQIKHQKLFKGKFSREEVRAQMRKVQKLSTETYHSKQL